MQNVIYPRMTDDLLQQLYAEERRKEKRREEIEELNVLRRLNTICVRSFMWLCGVWYGVWWCA